MYRRPRCRQAGGSTDSASALLADLQTDIIMILKSDCGGVGESQDSSPSKI